PQPLRSRAVDSTQWVLGHLGGAGVGGPIVGVGYFTDSNVGSNGPLAPIQRAGYTPVRINDIATIDLSTIDLLMVDESDNNQLSAPMLNRLGAIRTWVEGGGIFMVHDRFVAPDATPRNNPFFVGAPSTLAVRNFQFGADIDVIPPGETLVVNGPHGQIT